MSVGPSIKERKKATSSESSTKSRDLRSQQTERSDSTPPSRETLRFTHEKGNQAVQRLMKNRYQPKLAVSEPDDKDEREADRVAEQVMRMAEPATQRTCGCGDHTTAGGECEECRKKRLSRQHRWSTNHDGFSTVPSIVNEVLRSPGRLLDPAIRASMEPRFGRDFSRVRVHDDEKAAASARAVNAMAYTVGSDIVFGAGQYAPESSSGRRLIAHELAHTIQQQGADESVQALSVDDSPETITAEREADAAAESVINGGMPHVSSSVSAPALRRKKGSGEPLGGCGVCFRFFPGGLQYGGMVVHEHIQTIAKLRNPSLLVDEPLVGMGYAKEGLEEILGSLGTTEAGERPKGADIPDILDPVAEKPGAKRKRVEYLEIKPDNPKGIEDGKAAAARYKRKLRSMDEFKDANVKPKTDLILPPIPLYGDGRPNGCPKQHIHLRYLRFRDGDGEMNGIYLYSCAPAFSELVKRAECRRCSNKDRKKKKEKKKEPEKKPGKKQPPKKPSVKKPSAKAGNYGLSIGLFSSGSGAGNVSFGVAIFSHGTAIGTVSAGFVWDSNGKAVGAVGAGGSISNETVAALVASAGLVKDSSTTGVAGAGVGTIEGSKVTEVGTAGTVEQKGGQGTVVGEQGTSRGKSGGEGEAATSPADEATIREVKAKLEEAAKIASSATKANDAQKELLNYLATLPGDKKFTITKAEWIEKILFATQGLSAEQIRSLKGMNWRPGVTTKETLRRKVLAALKSKGEGGAETKLLEGKERPAPGHPGGEVGEATVKEPPRAQPSSTEAIEESKEKVQERLERLQKKFIDFNWKTLGRKGGRFEFSQPEGDHGPIKGTYYLKGEDDTGVQFRAVGEFAGELKTVKKVDRTATIIDVQRLSEFVVDNKWWGRLDTLIGEHEVLVLPTSKRN